MECIIYKAENKVNGNVYIGKTVKSLNLRKNSHKCDAYAKSYNSAFHNAIRKYGWDNFEWSILCETDSESKLNALEKFYISAYRKMAGCYNLTNGGDGLSGYKATNETKIKISKNHADFKGEKHPMYGKKHSQETCLKISEAKKGKKIIKLQGKSLSDNHKLKLSEAKKNKMNGKDNPFYGKTHSEETRKKISESLTGEKNKNYNTKFSEDHKNKISESIKKHWEKRRLSK